jgi:hypothetical protein
MPVRPVSDGKLGDRARPGERRRTGPGHIDSFGDGRTCAVDGCATRLSRYNAGAVCAKHADDVPQRSRS